MVFILSVTIALAVFLPYTLGKALALNLVRQLRTQGVDKPADPKFLDETKAPLISLAHADKSRSPDHRPCRGRDFMVHSTGFIASLPNSQGGLETENLWHSEVAHQPRPLLSPSHMAHPTIHPVPIQVLASPRFSWYYTIFSPICTQCCNTMYAKIFNSIFDGRLQR